MRQFGLASSAVATGLSVGVTPNNAMNRTCKQRRCVLLDYKPVILNRSAS